MVPFAGFELPVQYTSIIAESHAVRAGAGMFDVSHMARLVFTGDQVLEFTEHVTSNDVAKLEFGTGQYSLLPNETGGVVDDIIVYRIAPNEIRMVVNAANHQKDVAWLNQQNRFGVTMQDTTSQTSMIAVQGPKATEILAGLSDQTEKIKTAPMFGAFEATICGVTCFAARSGYTGEDGYELVCDNADAVKLWNGLLNAGVVACGLGSRDVLRVEAGLPLYGHELNDEQSPIEAGLGWVIGKEKQFIGSELIRQAKANGTAKRLVGVKLDSKRLPAIGQQVLVEGRSVGEISSGVYSPMLECGIGFAFVDSGVPLSTACALDFRGKLEPATLVNKRFFKRSS